MQTTETTATPPATPFLTRLRQSAAARDAFLVLAAQGLSVLITLGVDSMLFRTLSVPERGTLSTSLALQAVLLALADMGLSLTTIRVGAEYHSKGLNEEANWVFRRALFTRLALVLIVMGAALLLAPALAQFPLAARDRLQLVWAAAAALAGTSLVAWGADVSQSRRRFDAYFAQQMTAALLRAFLIYAVLWRINPQAQPSVSLSGEPLPPVTVPSEVLLWSIAAASCLAGAFSVIVQRDVLRGRSALDGARLARLKDELQNFSRYAGASVLLNGIGAYVEIFLLQALLNSAQTAVFDGARKLALILPLLTTALTTVLLPRAAALDSIVACRQYAWKALKVSAPLALLSAGGLAAVAGFAVPLFWGDKYGESIAPLRWLCVGYALNVLLNPLTLVLYPLKREGTIVALNAANLAFSFAAGYLLIPAYGPIGAAWSVLIVKAIIMGLCAVVLYAALRPPANPTQSASDIA